MTIKCFLAVESRQSGLANIADVAGGWKLGQSDIMRVLIEFGDVCGDQGVDAAWLINSPKNIIWLQNHANKLDSNSACFDEGMLPLTAIWHVFDHHPDWTEIIIRGVVVTSEIEEGIKPDAIVSSRLSNEFQLVRT